MPYNYNVAAAISDAEKSAGISASIITSILAEASGTQTHAKEHMKSEDFWTTQRTVGKAQVGTVDTVDGHLKSAYKKRTAHSMFDSPFSAVEATTAALNCPIGVQALKALLGNSEDDGIDLYSRTAVLTLSGTQQFNRSKDTGMNKTTAEYIVVCLRKINNILLIASAYPVDSTEITKNTQKGNDWYQSQALKTVIKEHAVQTTTIVNW
jgi:hypothetical protein